MNKNNDVVNELSNFLLTRVAAAETMFKNRKEVKEAYEVYDQKYQEILSILKKTDQQDLLISLTNAQVNHTCWTLKAVYIQAGLDMHKLFLEKD